MRPATRDIELRDKSWVKKKVGLLRKAWVGGEGEDMGGDGGVQGASRGRRLFRVYGMRRWSERVRFWSMERAEEGREGC